jgi:hypothetical protein
MRTAVGKGFRWLLGLSIPDRQAMPALLAISVIRTIERSRCFAACP